MGVEEGSRKKYTQEIFDRAVEEARAEGRHEGRQEMVDWVEKQYMGDNRPDRGTPEARAMLELAGEAAKFIRYRAGK